MKPDSTRSARPNDGYHQHSTFYSGVLTELIKLADVCLILGSAFGGYYGYIIIHNAPLAGGMGRYIVPTLLGAALFIYLTTQVQGYDLSRLRRVREQIPKAVIVWIVSVLILLVVAFVGKLSDLYSRFWLLSWTLLTLSLIVTQRLLLRSLLIERTRDFIVRNVAIVGVSDAIASTIEKLRKSVDEVNICGIFSDGNVSGGRSECGLEVLGDTDDLLEYAREVKIDHVILVLPLTDSDRIRAFVDKLRRLPGELLISVEPISNMLPVRRLSYIGDLPLLEIVQRPLSRWGAIFKWVEDKVIAALILIVLAPLIILIASLIKWDSPGPVLFIQKRVGFDNKIINILKFRTMYVEEADASGRRRTVRGDPRITRVGRTLRRMSLDELPQLINVLKGEMSLVGPRPHAIGMQVGDCGYFDAISDYSERHRVKPGITGWAQINGLRGEVDSLEKGRTRVEYDLEYIERWSLWLDLEILLRTLPAVWSCRDAY